MFVRTERLLLRPSWPEDLDELLALLSEEDIARNLGVSAMPRSREELQALLVRPRSPRLPHFFINLRENHSIKLVGGIGLGQPEDDVELGYWIAPQYRGRGFAEEAARAVLTHAKAIGHRTILACHFADSPASGAVLEKAGFVRTGETRDRFSAERGEVAPANVYVADLRELPLFQDAKVTAEPAPQ